jgi:predicted  nucleic acid-binding Zn-ribbon protein
MQLHCTYCGNMFAISREDILAGLEHMEENKLTYYDAHCPKCRRANRVEKARMVRFFPDWKNAIKTMAKAADQATSAPAKPAESSKAVKAAAKSVESSKPVKAASKANKKPAKAKKK